MAHLQQLVVLADDGIFGGLDNLVSNAQRTKDAERSELLPGANPQF
jgi:hypothetical protein